MNLETRYCGEEGVTLRFVGVEQEVTVGIQGGKRKKAFGWLSLSSGQRAGL